MRTMHCWFVAVGLLVAACRTECRTGGSSLEQGLTIFNQSRDGGLVGMYAEGDRAVLFETVSRPLTQDIIDHYNAHEIPLTRPLFWTRWTDEDGRVVSQDGDWDEVIDVPEPARWEVTLDLTLRAGAALRDASLASEVIDEQTRLVRDARAVPEASARTWQPTPEELAQISERQVAYGYLGHSWRSYFYVRKPSGVNFHQGTSWNNHYYSNGSWHYYNNLVRNNDVDSPDYECSGVYSAVQDYKSYSSNDGTLWLGNYARCGGTYASCSTIFLQRFNCRSEALRQQVWVTGNVRCSAYSGMCDQSEGAFAGAYCGRRTTCSPRGGC